MNIIPEKQSGRIYNYFCTWKSQYCFANGRGPEDLMTEASMFEGDGAWCSLYPEIRGELYFLMDSGWDVPFTELTPTGELQLMDFTSRQPDPGKFPSLRGTPTEQLTQLNEMVKAAGWHELALWVATNAYDENGNGCSYESPDPVVENYWRGLMLNSREAGITYWKADWGNVCGSVPFRRMMTELGHKYHPELIIEHGRGNAPYNGSAKHGDCRAIWDKEFFGMMTGFSAYSDALRTYDVADLEHATTLDRVDAYSRTAVGIINCEHLAYIGAVLGCAIGIMQSTQNSKAGLEPVAAVRWHRAAPPFAGTETLASEKLLTERHYIDRPTWYYEDGPRDLFQQAPAIIARNTALPTVINGDEEWIPFVAASLNPSGAYSVGAFRRQSDDAVTVLPEVLCRPEQACEQIGIFGSFASVSFDVSDTGRRVSRVLAQGLICGDAEDITDACLTDDGRIRITEDLIHRIFKTSDESEPAIMLAVTYR